MKIIAVHAYVVRTKTKVPFVSAEVHGRGVENTHLCLAIRNNHYYETLIKGNPSTSPRTSAKTATSAPPPRRDSATTSA